MTKLSLKWPIFTTKGWFHQKIGISQKWPKLSKKAIFLGFLAFFGTNPTWFRTQSLVGMPIWLFLFDFSFEKTATFCLVHHFHVSPRGYGSIWPICGRSIVIAGPRKVNVGWPAHDLHARMPVFVGEPRPEPVDAWRLWLWPCRVFVLPAACGLFLPCTMPVAIAGRYDVLTCLETNNL